jgi:hypothetical protein
MNATQLTPVDNNYLTSNLRYQQTKQNQDTVVLNENNVTANSIPKVWTYGDGTVNLSGNVTIAGTPTTNYELCSLPSWAVPYDDKFLPVTVIRDGAFIPNAIKINSSGNSISDVKVTNGGSYTSVPTLGVVNNTGSGAVFSTIMMAASALVADGGTTGSVPGQTLTVSGGTSTTAATFPVISTFVASASVAVAGSGGTDGSQTVTGTTGTGTKFEATVTISGGAIASVDAISVAGSYTVNPTSLTNEPVTGAGLTGAQLALEMATETVGAALETGIYTALPSNPAATAGGGAGVELTVTWEVKSVTVSNGGSGYASPVSVIFSSGAATATASLDSTSREIILINRPNVGDIVHFDNVSLLVNSYKGQ